MKMRKQNENTKGIEPQDTIIILVSEYKELLKNAEKLRRLEDGGVDNWEWYSDSLYPDEEESYDAVCDELDQRFSGNK